VEVVCDQKDKKTHTTLDISKSLLLFDGNRGHSVEDFTGERYSLVYFTQGQYLKPTAGEKHGIDFSTKAFREKARNKVKELGLAAGKGKECKDTKFVSYRVSYLTLPDKRRRALVHLQGVSGGERCAVIGDEDRVGSAHYVYKKAKGFTLGPALETYRIADVRAWCAKLLPKGSQKTIRKRTCLRSYASEMKGKRKATASTTAPLKRARAGA